MRPLEPRPFDCPGRVVNDGMQVGHPPAVGPTEPDHFGGIYGHWSNCDLYVVAPAAFFTTALGVVRVYAKQGAARFLLQTISLPLVPIEAGGAQQRGLVAQVRGHPCDGFEFECEITIAAPITGVHAFIEAWGDQSMPYEAGERLGDAMTNGRFPQRAAHLLGFDVAAGVWERLITDAAGRLQIAGGGAGGALAVIEQFAPVAEDNTNGIIAIQHKPLAVSTYAPSLFTQFASDPDVSIKAAAGSVFSFSCRNLNAATRFAQLHNKASPPVGADVPLLTFAVPPGGLLVIGADFFTANGIFFSTGIAFGFSTTELTYTAGAAADQVTQVVFK